MGKERAFGDVLEAVEQLPLEDQEALVEIIGHRIAEQRRAELASDVCEAQEEYRAGRARPVTPDELMDEILS